MLRISKAMLEPLRRHAEETFPRECCGILLGTRNGEVGVVSEAARCANTRADSPETRYNIAPQELIAAQKRAREVGVEIIGFYHSHPGHPAQWSATDLEEAHWSGCAYVILSVEQGRAAAVRSFVLRVDSTEKSFKEEALEETD